MGFNLVKLFASFVLALMLLIFASQNLHPVWIRFIAGPPVQLPLVVVVVGATLVGYAVATFSYLLKMASNRKNQSKHNDEDEE